MQTTPRNGRTPYDYLRPTSLWRVPMQRTVHRFLALFGFFLWSVTTSAADPSPKAEGFVPYELVGGWQFVNSNSGAKFGGEIKVKVNSLEKSGSMRAVVSYDGRQLNDSCGTRGIFSDEPVEAEVVKLQDEYRISFMAKCLRGQSPRLFSWTLVCTDAVCSQPTVLPHGKGVLTLTEKR